VFAKIRCAEGPQVPGNKLTCFKSNLHKDWLLQNGPFLTCLEESTVLHDKTFKLSAVQILQRHSSV